MNLIFHPIFLDHRDLKSNNECPERLSLVDLEAIGYEKPKSGESLLVKAHDSEYIEKIRSFSLENKTHYIEEDFTYVMGKTFESASYSAGASVMASEKQAFAVVRPPGHHAGKNFGMGFCIFNNIAIASLLLAEKGKKVAIIDVDAHHGNGTQDIVMGRDNILFMSTHQKNEYPYSGNEIVGNCFNFPLKVESGDKEFFNAWKLFAPELEKFNPDYIALSMGFDAYYKDYGFESKLKFSLEPHKMLLKLKENYKLFGVLEGGYNPNSVKDGIEAVLNS